MSDQPVPPDEVEDAVFSADFDHFFPGRTRRGFAIENDDDDDGAAVVDRFFPPPAA